ncbi:MAG: hypothetical protein H6622_14005 [Halobacteriovoraceae bacterium]|nr:hypothetical protein [Halobacteriovoraceae bacterium]
MKHFIILILLSTNLHAQDCIESVFYKNIRQVRAGLGGRLDDLYFPHYALVDTSDYISTDQIEIIYKTVPNLLLGVGEVKDNVQSLFTFYKDSQRFSEATYLDPILIDIEENFSKNILNDLYYFINALKHIINKGLPTDEQVYPLYAAFRKTDGTVQIGPLNLHYDLPYLVSVTTLIGDGTEYEVSNYNHKIKKVSTGETIILSGLSRVKYPPQHRSSLSAGKRLTLLIQWEKY